MLALKDLSGSFLPHATFAITISVSVGAVVKGLPAESVDMGRDIDQHFSALLISRPDSFTRVDLMSGTSVPVDTDVILREEKMGMLTSCIVFHGYF